MCVYSILKATMAANASTNTEHIDSLENESATNPFESLAGLFENCESGAELSVIERDGLAKRFELQLRQLAGSLDASSFGHFLYISQCFNLVLSRDLDWLVHSVKLPYKEMADN